MLHFTLVLLAWLAATVGAVPTVHQLQTSLAPGQGAVLGAWRSWHADMARIRMDGQPLLTPDVMPAQYAWTLNPAQLQRAFVSRAKGPRLRRVVHRLMRGRPVKLGVIGTSVSWGTGGWEAQCMQHRATCIQKGHIQTAGLDRLINYAAPVQDPASVVPQTGCQCCHWPSSSSSQQLMSR